MDEWIEHSNEQSFDYSLECPVCGYCYSPAASPDGTISASEIHNYCPKCGKKLNDPAKDSRW